MWVVVSAVIALPAAARLLIRSLPYSMPAAALEHAVVADLARRLPAASPDALVRKRSIARRLSDGSTERFPLGLPLGDSFKLWWYLPSTPPRDVFESGGDDGTTLLPPALRPPAPPAPRSRSIARTALSSFFCQ